MVFLSKLIVLFKANEEERLVIWKHVGYMINVIIKITSLLAKQCSLFNK